MIAGINTVLLSCSDNELTRDVVDDVFVVLATRSHHMASVLLAPIFQSEEDYRLNTLEMQTLFLYIDDCTSFYATMCALQIILNVLLPEDCL